MTEVVDFVFRIIDKRVDRLIEEHPVERGDQLEKLSKLYWDSWEHLKNKMGTSAGWPWFGEYIVFRTLKRHIEKRTEVGFQAIHRKAFGSVKVFVGEDEGKSLLLAHNARLELKDSKAVRPDIFLLDGENLVFTIDVKVYITSTWAMARANGGALNKLSRTVQDTKWQGEPLGYLICLHEDMPAQASRCNVYQEKGVKIVGPRGGSIENKLRSSAYPMTSFKTCINEILGRL